MVDYIQQRCLDKINSTKIRIRLKRSKGVGTLTPTSNTSACMTIMSGLKEWEQSRRMLSKEAKWQKMQFAANSWQNQ